MKQKALIIVGGNSKLVSKFLEINLYKLYQKIIVISHRKYNGDNNYEIIDFLDPKLLQQTLEKIITNDNFYFDLIISNTPTENVDFQNKDILEWSLVPIKVMNMNFVNKFVKKLIFTGSCLPLLPLYNERFYKKLKNNEMKSFVKTCLKLNQNATYFILPPLKFENVKKLNPIYDNYEKWAFKLKEELSLNNSIVYPNGIVGLITKMFFFIKFGRI